MVCITAHVFLLKRSKLLFDSYSPCISMVVVLVKEQFSPHSSLIFSLYLVLVVQLHNHRDNCGIPSVPLHFTVVVRVSQHGIHHIVDQCVLQDFNLVSFQCRCQTNIVTINRRTVHRRHF